MEKRTIGRSGIQVSALGFGCWAIGGEWADTDGQPLGWGVVNDDESVRAIRRALDRGITFFDTADVYGTGHSEEILGRTLAGHRDEVVIATKWGNTFDPERRIKLDQDTSADYARRALTHSLRRLRTTHIDLYQLHLGDADAETGAALRDVCEGFVREGLIRAYAWSTDDPERAAVFAEGPNCAGVQHQLNVMEDAPEMLALCARENLASINRTPLAMGLLGGKYVAGQKARAGDIRSAPPAWLKYFDAEGRVTPEWAGRIDAVRQVLASGDRTLAQGALAWIWARSPHTIPIPGFRTVGQAEENALAMEHGPLTPAEFAEVEKLLNEG
ncbi:aldo/keto reductase [Streptomyces sp. A7024]|uniref:Aldo/keto reductase n=1 Tax=Streptomyces coryli TaxID=1128680 RepID=A0A6G4UE83_9ACTN|nr:aldo/keto reductase [Streptomyces coryli]NGN69748.1 aldo/keto reductase [Streptomyces coryli]